MFFRRRVYFRLSRSRIASALATATITGESATATSRAAPAVAPEATKSMRIAIADLGLDRLDVIHVGKDTYPLTERIRAVAFDRLHADVTPLRG